MNTPPERWLPIPGFTDRYEVSDLGRVRSLRLVNGNVDRLRPEPKILTGSRDKDGRQRVVLYRGDGSFWARPIGVLVLLAFVGPRPERYDCRHGDGCAANDHLANLTWSTHSENMADKKVHGTWVAPPVRRGERNNRATLTEAQVRLIRAEPNYRGVNARLAERFGILATSVRNIRAGLTWRHLT